MIIKWLASLFYSQYCFLLHQWLQWHHAAICGICQCDERWEWNTEIEAKDSLNYILALESLAFKASQCFSSHVRCWNICNILAAAGYVPEPDSTAAPLATQHRWICKLQLVLVMLTATCRAGKFDGICTCAFSFAFLLKEQHCCIVTAGRTWKFYLCYHSLL